MIWSNIFDLEASGSIGTSANRLGVELIESDDGNGVRRNIDFFASATTGDVYLDMTGRRRDGDNGVFIVPVRHIDAGGNIDVKMENGEHDPADGGTFAAVKVGVDSSSDFFHLFFHPDDAGLQNLDPGAFVNLGGTATVATTYDFQPTKSTFDGSGAATGGAGLIAGGNIVLNAADASSKAADHQVNVVATVTLTGAADYLETTTNGNINVGEATVGGVLRVHTANSTNGNVMLTVPHHVGRGQDLDLIHTVTDGLISALGTVLLQVGDDMTSDFASLITAGTSITIDGDYGNSLAGTGSTILINGSISSPLTNINGDKQDDTIHLNYTHGINNTPVPGGASLTNAIVNTDGKGGTNHTIVSDTHATTPDVGVLTESTVTGLGMGGKGVHYTNDYTLLQYMEVDLNDGLAGVGDTLSVLSTHTNDNTLVLGGASNDTVNVGSHTDSTAAPFTTSDLLGILGQLTVDAAGGAANRLLISNYALGKSQTVTMTNAAITNFAPVEIDYKATGGHYTDPGQHDGIHLFGANVGGNTFDVQSTLAGNTNQIDGDGGANDFFNVWSDAAGSGAQTPTSTGNDQGIQGELTVVGGTGAANRLIASDLGHASADTNVIVTDSTITNLAPAQIRYFANGHFTDPAAIGSPTDNSTLDGVLLLGPSVGGNTFNVQSTLNLSTTLIKGGGGVADVFNVFSDATGSGPGAYTGATSTLHGIKGTLTILGGTSVANRLIVSNYGTADATDDMQILISQDAILNFAPGIIHYSAAGAGNFTDAGGAHDGILLQGGHNLPSTFITYSTLAGSTTLLSGGILNDSFNVGTALTADVSVPTEPTTGNGVRLNAFDHTGTAVAAVLGTLGHDQGDLNYIQGLLTIVGNGSVNNGPGDLGDSLSANDHGKLLTDGHGNPILGAASPDNPPPAGTPLPQLHQNEDGPPADDAYDASIGQPSDPAFGYNYIVNPTQIRNDATPVAAIPPLAHSPLPRTFAGIDYNVDGNAANNTVALLRLDGTDRTNRFAVTPSTTAEYVIDGNMPNNSCRKDGGDYLQLDTTHLGDNVPLTGDPVADAKAIKIAQSSRKLHIFGSNEFPIAPNGPEPIAASGPSGVDTPELAAPTGNGFWDFVTGPNNTTLPAFAKPVYFLSIEQFNHVAAVAKVSVPPPNSNAVPRVDVLDAETGYLKFTVQPYENVFHGGINVAMGDLNCDGLPDLATIPQQGHTAEVKIFDGSPDKNGNYKAKILNDYLAFNQNFLGGGSIAIGDTNFDGHNDLVVGAGQNSLPVVEVYNGETVVRPTTNHVPTLLKTFNAYDSAYRQAITQTFRGGVNVAVGDLNNDGYADIVATVASNGPPIVNIFNGNGYGFIRGFNAFSTATAASGLNVAVGDVTGDGVRDVIVSSAPVNIPLVSVFSGATVFAPGNPVAVKTLTVDQFGGPLFFRGSIMLQAAPNDGGNPGTVELDVVFAELIPDQTHGNVATDLLLSITAFNPGGGSH